MVKRVIWSKCALNDRKEILNYWKQHNQSIAYSLKLNALFKKVAKLLATHPQVPPY